MQMIYQNQEKQEIINKVKVIMSLRNEEKNNLPFKRALKVDKRTFCEYYISLIQIKHVLFFSFYYDKDYNSKIIKIDLFFIGFIINYFVNGLFFTDDTMHKIYEDYGVYNFIFQLPQIIYSSLISLVLNTLLKFLALSEGNISDFKRNRKKLGLEQREYELYNKLKIKFLLYFIISSIFLLGFWYYLSMFCAIYRNTQLHLIKDTLISFALSFVYPFGICLLPGLFRIPALSDPKVLRHLR